MDPNFIYHSDLQSLLPTGLQTDPQTPLGTLNKLVSDFTQIQNIQSFKDVYKRLRKHLKENPVLYKDHKAQGLLSALALSLCRESTLGTIPDIKGLINDLLEAVLAHEEYTQEVPRVFEESIIEFLENIPHMKLEGLGKPGTISLQQVDDHLKILNQFGELLPVMAKHCPKILGFLLGYYIEVLEQFADQFENNKYHSAQYLTVLNFVLRGCCTLVLNFKDAIIQAVEAHDTELITDLMTISLCSRVFLSAISSLNPKCVSQCTILAVLIDSNLLKVSDQEFEAFHLQLSDATSPFTVRVFRQTEENLKRRRLSVIQALILFKEGFDIFTNFQTIPESAMSIILNSCDDSNAHVRHTAFRTLQGALDNTSNNDKAIRRFFEKGRRYHDIFELLMKNWESSVKGMTQTIEVSFATLLKIIDRSRLDDKNKVFRDLENHVMALSSANVKKRYGALVLLCEYIDVQYLLNSNKRLIYELLTANQEVYVASSVELVEKLLARLHAKISAGDPNLKKEEIFQKWSQYWVQDFMTCLEDEEFNVVKGIILHIIPTVQKIDSLSCGHLLQLLSNKDQTKNNYLWCYVSLLKIARANNLLDYSADKKGYTFRGTLNDSHIDGSYLQKLLLSGNRNVILNMLELLTTSPKPADIPTPFEYNLILTSLKYNLRTSHSDTRNNTITVFKKFFNRLRKIYEPTLLHYFPAHATNFKDLDLQKLEAEAKKPYKAGFTNMISFLKATITSLIENLIPEVEFETIYPVLELLKLIFQIFGLNNSRKNNLKGTAILHYLEIYNINLFNILLVSFKSAWESVRLSSYELLLEFPDNSDIVTSEYLNRTLLPSALELTKNPIIKNTEGGALLLNLVAQKFVDRVDFSILESGSQGVPAAASSLKFSYYILNLLESRLEKVKAHFLEDQAQFSNNLFHGLITTLRFQVQSILPKSSEGAQNLSEYRAFFAQLTQVIGRILCYTTKVTSDDLISSILSYDRSAKDLDSSVQVERTTATDCRGHFITEKTAAQDEAAKLKVENIFTDDAEENIPAESENINVIAFYLIARESGLLLQTISDILPKLNEQNAEIIDLSNVRTLVTIYFHALLNLKHLGALDSIAQGLSIFAKNFHGIKSPELSRLGEDLLNVLLNSLRQGDFRNVLRRSSGIPQAIICVLKTEPYGQKGLLFPRTMTELLDLAEHGFTDEIKIHALNILKFIFRDSTLKSDIEAYISKGLIIAIRGFSSNDWMIRNSSLMLFSSIAKRTVGAEKIADEQSNRSNLTILEFFTRAPELANFFLNEVQNYIDSIEQVNHKESLYPSLYPIALLMSRLLPYDTKKGSSQAHADKGEDEENEGEEAGQSGQTEELVAKIERFLPLFVQAAHNKNYMGRLMCAKAVVSLIKHEDISTHVMEMLELDHLSQRRVLKTDHNYGHGLLLQIYYLLKNHFDIQENSSSTSEKTAFNRNFQKLVNKISERRLFLIDNTCPFISTVYLQILKKIIKHNQDHDAVQYGEIFAYAYGYSVQMLREECKNKTFRLSEDFGHSILRLKYLQYALIFDRVVNKDFEGHKTLLELFVEKYKENLSERRTDDNELFKTLLIYFNKQLTLLGPSALTSDDKKTILSHLNTLLGQPDFICHEFVSCIIEILNIILNMEGYVGLPPYQASLLIDQLNTLYAKFPQNTKLMEAVIQLYGAVLPVYLNSGAVWDKNKVLGTYNAICEKYSQAAQVDFLRIAVVQSLKLSFATVMDSKNIQDFGIFLDFSRVIIRLLQDEIPEIRSKIANHVSRAFRLSEGQAQFKFNANYILEKYFEYIVLKFEGPSSVTSPKGYNVGQLVENSYGLSGNNPLLLAQFLLSYIFESEFDKYNEMDHFEKRIYAVEKPNKFYNIFLVQKVAYAVLIKLMSRQAISRYIIEDSIKNKNYKFNLVNEKELERYTADVLGRDEFLHECILRKVYQENIVPGADRANNQFLQGLKHNIGTLEIYLKNLVENSLN